MGALQGRESPFEVKQPSIIKSQVPAPYDFQPFVGQRREDLGITNMKRHSVKEIGGPGYGGFYKKDSVNHVG